MALGSQCGKGVRVGTVGAGFETLWREAENCLRIYCYRTMRNADDAEDLLQRVAIRAWRGYPTFRGDASFLTWVMKIAEREAIRMKARELQRQCREVPLEGMNEPSGNEVSPVWTATPGWLQNVIAEADGLGVLTAVECEVVNQRLRDPYLSWQGVADKISLTASACAVAYCRAIPKLRVFLFLRHQDALGGSAAVVEAFRLAVSSSRDPLGLAEREVFQRVVVEGRRDYRRRGWQADLRRACGVVIRYLAVTPVGPDG